MPTKMRLICLLCFCLALPLAAPLPSAAAAASLSDADREHYKNAFLHYKKKRYRDAQLHAKRAKNQLPAKVIRWLVLTRRDSKPSYKEARRFLEENPHWPRQDRLQAAVERAMPWDLPDRKIHAWFEQRPPVSADGTLHYAGALLRAKKLEKARALIRETWREGNFDRAQEQAFYKRYRKALVREDHIARLDSILWRRGTKTAKRQARRVGKGYPQLAEARILLAYRKPGVDGALKRVPKKLRSDPGLIYDRANWRRRKGRYEGVIELLYPPKPDLPRPERWWPLRRWAAQESIERGRYDVAYQIAKKSGLESGSEFAEATWLAGWVAYRFQKKPKRAYRHFTDLYYGSSSPISKGRGAYWAGEAATKLGKRDWAIRWYKAAAEHATSFYGQLALARLGEPVSLDLSGQPQPSEERRKAFAQRELARVAEVLGALGQRDHQKRFLMHLGDLAASPEEHALAADLANAQGRPDVAVNIAKRARRSEVVLPDQLFPVPFKPSGKTVEAALVLAVARQESHFNPRAVSHAGARGLMQLMPATAKKMAKKLRVKYNSRRLTRDPDYNMKLGSAYLARLLDRYDGSHILALAAYNAGPSRVRSWIRAHGDPRKPGIDPINWVERIPFNETRNYVQRVLEGLVIYRQKLNTGIVELPLQPLGGQSASLGQ